jgi:acyl-CoA thioesterase I
MRDIRICFFGDSFVNGTGDPTYLGWTGRVCAAMAQPNDAPDYELTHYSLGIRGNHSKQIEARWQAEAALRLPADCDARVVFAFGTNDNRIEAGKMLVEPKNSIDCARRILTQAKAQFPTLLIGPPPVADQARNQSQWASSKAYAELCATLEVPYLDIYQPLSENLVWREEIAADGFHPGAAGYAAWAELVLQWTDWQRWFE